MVKINNDQKTIISDWCYYLVAFLDVLGQKEVFNKLCRIKSGDELDDTLRGEISENLVYLEELRENLKKYFIEYSSDEPSKINVDVSFKEKFNQMRKAEIYFQFFSDSVIAFVPLEFQSFYTVAANSVYGVLGGCCGAVLGTLVAEHAIRGGIEISWATRLKSGDIYGPALNKAYHLESKVANYPRIIIGGEVWNFLNSLSDKVQQHPNQTQQDIDGCKRIADHCLKFISKDIDGTRILDYLGPDFLKLNKNSPNFFAIVDESKKFISASLDKNKREGNSKLESKYQYLGDYFQSRSAIVEEARKSSIL
jgi:hypothetical protein